MFNFKLIPFLSSKKPCPVKQGLEEGTTVLRRQVVEYSPEKALGGVQGVLKEAPHSGNTGKNFLI